MGEIRVLSLWQPWATLLANGIKMNETRPSSTNHTAEKGIYLIHAAKKWTRWQKELCFKEQFYSKLIKLNIGIKRIKGYAGNYLRSEFDLPLGQIIGSFEVKECMISIDDRINSGKVFLHSQSIIKKNCTCYIKDIVNHNEVTLGDYSEGRSIWIGQNHRALKYPIEYKGGQGYYQNFKGNIENLIFK